MPTCRSCSRRVPDGELRCFEHEQSFQAWLRAQNGDGRRRRVAPDVYQPRYNGVRAAVGERPRARTGARRPRPGEALNFDGE